MDIDRINNAFFALLQYSLWSKSVNHEIMTLTSEEWAELFSMAKKQTLAGIMFDGIMKLPVELMPPKPIKISWALQQQVIEQQNELLNNLAPKVSKFYEGNGFSNVVLKGQGLSTFYPIPCHRQAGDIDIFLQGGRKKILAFLRKSNPDVHKSLEFHHFDTEMEGIEVECHNMCSYLADPFRNRMLQKMLGRWTSASINNKVDLPNGGCIPIPTVEMNQVYVLLHIFRHLFTEGIGLRQLVDYVVLMNATYTDELAVVYRQNIEKLGLTGFAKAVFYVLVHHLGYPTEKLPITIENAKFGPMLIDEIMQAGNFGRYDSRINHKQGLSSLHHFIIRTKRNFHFAEFFPRETFGMVYFKIMNFFFIRYYRYFYRAD